VYVDAAIANNVRRSSKRSLKKQMPMPFPDQARGRAENSRPPLQEGNAVTSATLQPLDVNAPRHESFQNKQIGGPTRAPFSGNPKSLHGPNETFANEVVSHLHVNANTQQSVVPEKKGPREGTKTVAAVQVNEQFSEGLRGVLHTRHQYEQSPTPHYAAQGAPHNVHGQIGLAYHEDIDDDSNGDFHNPAQPPLQHEPRSQSALSNISRPLATRHLALEQNAQETFLHLSQSQRVHKANGTVHANQQLRSNGGTPNPGPGPSSPSQHFLRTAERVWKDHENYQNQQILVESQQQKLRSQAAELESQRKELETRQSNLESRDAKIRKLELAIGEANKRCQLREEEKIALAARVKRFGEISARYKAHMNDVVIAQKHLMGESARMKKDSVEIREENKAMMEAFTNRDFHERSLRSLIDESKTIPPIVEKAGQCKLF
jgi:hypothetical protein